MGSESRGEAAAARVEGPVPSGEAAVILGLRRELKETREQMQAVIDLLQATNEALQSANEELLASNEELHRILEELESAREGAPPDFDHLTRSLSPPDA